MQVHISPQTPGQGWLLYPARKPTSVREGAGSLDTRKNASCAVAGSQTATASLRSLGPQEKRPCRNEAWKLEEPLCMQDFKPESAKAMFQVFQCHTKSA